MFIYEIKDINGMTVNNLHLVVITYDGIDKILLRVDLDDDRGRQEVVAGSTFDIDHKLYKNMNFDNNESMKFCKFIVDGICYNSYSFYKYLKKNIKNLDNVIYIKSLQKSQITEDFLIDVPNMLDIELSEIIEIHPVDAMIATHNVSAFSKTQVVLVGLNTLNMYTYLNNRIDKDGSIVVLTSYGRFRISVIDISRYNKLMAKIKFMEG